MATMYAPKYNSGTTGESRNGKLVARASAQINIEYSLSHCSHRVIVVAKNRKTNLCVVPAKP